MGNLVTIPDTYDTFIQKEYLREFSESRYPIIELLRIDRVNTYVDDLYNEAPARKFMEPVSLKCLPRHDPNRNTLTKYGIDQQRNVLFQIPTLELANIGYLYDGDDWMLGDVIKWGGDYYEILNQIRPNDGYWATTNIPFYLILGADYYRQGS